MLEYSGINDRCYLNPERYVWSEEGIVQNIKVKRLTEQLHELSSAIKVIHPNNRNHMLKTEGDWKPSVGDQRYRFRRNFIARSFLSQQKTTS